MFPRYLPPLSHTHALEQDEQLPLRLAHQQVRPTQTRIEMHSRAM